MTTDTLRARAEALIKTCDGFDGEFRFIPAWEGDNGGPCEANRVDFPDSIYFVPDGVEWSPNYPTDDGCTLIAEQLDEHVAVALIEILNSAGPLIRSLLDDLPEPATGEQPAPLTVGAALADARVQDGSHVAEYRNGPWRQLGFDGVRLFSSGRWKATSDRMYVEAYALPCRLVPIADADRDPGERGAL